MSAEPPQHQVVISSAPPNRRERVIAIVVVAISFLTLVAMTPFARVHLARVDAFIPTYQAALLVNDLITAVLLFGQFSRLRSYAALSIACAYMFDALIIVPHTLSFPGLFGPQGVIGGDAQTRRGFMSSGMAASRCLSSLMRCSPAAATPAQKFAAAPAPRFSGATPRLSCWFARSSHWSAPATIDCRS